MKKPRSSREYIEGASEFLRLAYEKASTDGIVWCPCVKCVNAYGWSRDIVFNHLVCYGISPGYNTWFGHGENRSKASSSKSNESHAEQVPDDNDALVGMLDEMIDMHCQSVHENYNINDELEQHREGPNIGHPSESCSEDVKKFYNLLNDAKLPLYEGCENYTKLSAIVHLYHAKCLSGWSNKSFSLLLYILKRMLPASAKVPKDCYEAKKIIKDLGLGYEKIPACPNNCMLFWKENANDEVCSVCGASRWVTDETNLESNVRSSSKKKKKKPAKILRWFPLKVRLQRLFMSSKTASSMKWHAEGRTKDGMIRHPADALAWKEFDSRYADFASDSRNIRLGLASDGFNPFGNLSTSYSIWPVILIPYNLPPWLCMKRSSLILSLLIPGPNSPGNDIDVYLQPLIDELKELWDIGVATFDASTKDTFQLRAALMWTINDFPAYGDLSGWNTKGALACPSCNYSTCSQWLKYGGKYCFMGHRRFLDKDHRFRKDRKNFDGTQEMEVAPTMMSGDEILRRTEGVNCRFGKIKDKVGKKRKRQGEVQEVQPWKKRSIFFTLPYWEHHLLRHNLDVMHIEKNVCDNLLGTLLNLDGKTKDNLKARLDLQDMGLRHQLHPQKRDSNKTYLPPACFSMDLKEKEALLTVLKKVKVPDGYASNISRCVQIKQRKIIGLKSHDCHILMQQLLPIALRGILPKKVTAPMIELCCIFRELCSKVFQIDELERLNTRIAETLCQLEIIFPPSFFTVMVHLVTHLATEAKIAGPVNVRWMYFVERYLGRLKTYVGNRAYPEGSIAEGYQAEECLTFCSRYLDDVETIFNQPARNIDDSVGSVENIQLIDMLWTHPHRYVLFNNDKINEYQQRHKESIRRAHRPGRLTDEVVHKLHMEKFCDWFRRLVERMNDLEKANLSDEVKWLARGPNIEARRFKRYVVNGFKFRTKASEESMKTQNSGVSVVTEGGNIYYGVLTDIIELNYYGKSRVVLFKCDWADVTVGRGYKKDEFGFDLVNFSRLIHTGDRLTDEPYVLATQATQVYYVEDARYPGWHVVVKTKPRDVFDLGSRDMDDDDDVNTYYDNEPYNLIIEDAFEEGNDNFNWVRNDVEGAILDQQLPLDNQAMEGNNMNDSNHDEDV